MQAAIATHGFVDGVTGAGEFGRIKDNQAEALLRPDSHGVRHIASRFTKGLFGTVGSGLAKVELSSYSGTIRILKRD